jgi:hypothetical protein
MMVPSHRAVGEADPAPPPPGPAGRAAPADGERGCMMEGGREGGCGLIRWRTRSHEMGWEVREGGNPEDGFRSMTFHDLSGKDR